MKINNYNIDEIQSKISNLQSDNPKGSIVFCSYNEENYVLPLLHSISNLETTIPIEIIAVNNCSSDKTNEILESSGVNVIQENIKGISYARRASVEASKGEIIFQTDSDTIIPVNRVDLHYSYYKDGNIVGVHGESTFDKVHFLFYLQKLGVITFVNILKLLGNKRIGRVLGYNMSFRKDIAMLCGSYDKGRNFGEDVFLFKKMSKYGKIVSDPSDKLKVLTSGRRYSSYSRVIETILYRRKIYKGILPMDMLDYR